MSVETLKQANTAERPGLLLGAGALQISGVLSTIVAPLIADGLEASGLDNAAIGAQLTALHIVQVIVILLLAGTGVVTRIDRRTSGVIGCLIGAGGFALAALVAGTASLAACMMLVGLGAGVAYASGGSALSFAANTERAYSVVTIASIVIGAAVLVGTSFVTVGDARTVVFGGLAAVLVLLGLAATRLPHLPTADEQRHDDPDKPVGRWLDAPGASLIAGYFLLNLGLLAVWTFSGQMGRAAGLSQDQSWVFLGAAQVLSVLGCVIAWRMGSNPAKISILIASVVALAVGKLMVGSTILTAYLIGNLITNLTFYTVIPFVFAAGADLNPRSGRLVVVVGASAMAAGAIAPLLGGAIAGEAGNWPLLGGVAALIILASLPLLVIAVRVAWARKHGAA